MKQWYALYVFRYSNYYWPWRLQAFFVLNINWFTFSFRKCYYRWVFDWIVVLSSTVMLSFIVFSVFHIYHLVLEDAGCVFVGDVFVLVAFSTKYLSIIPCVLLFLCLCTSLRVLSFPISFSSQRFKYLWCFCIGIKTYILYSTLSVRYMYIHIDILSMNQFRWYPYHCLRVQSQ